MRAVLFPTDGQKFENGPFTYAPENATYVEMSGILSYKIDNEQGYEVNR